MSLQDSIEARFLILLFPGLLLGPQCYLTPVSTNQFQCTAGPNSNLLNLVEALSSWQRLPGGAAASPTELGSLVLWENGLMDGARRQHSHIPLPSEKTMEKQKQNQVGSTMLSSVGHTAQQEETEPITQGASLRFLLKSKHMFCASLGFTKVGQALNEPWSWVTQIMVNGIFRMHMVIL